MIRWPPAQEFCIFDGTRESNHHVGALPNAHAVAAMSTESDKNPVFYSESKHRWNRFLWLFRLAVFLLLSLLAVVLLAVFRHSSASLPGLVDRSAVYRRVLNPDDPLLFQTQQNRAFMEAKRRSALLKEEARLRAERGKHGRQGSRPDAIHAAFYVNWDLQSYYSLKANVEKLTMVFPEWFFVADSADTIVCAVDERALELLRGHPIKILPMVSNFTDGRWNPLSVRRIISSPERTRRFVSSMVRALRLYGFAGINIDFEELAGDVSGDLQEFQACVYDSLHSLGYLVTQDVVPSNRDYDLAVLGRKNDFLVLMAYDQHFATSSPGPLADQAWVESAIRTAARSVPMKKIILGIPAYGYDWPDHGTAVEVTYYEALANARESEAIVQFDTLGYNLSYGYDDELNIPHVVYFVDAVTTFNALRAASDRGMAGWALWRLGSEDPRIWSFYGRDLRWDAFPSNGVEFDSLRNSLLSNNVDFVGEGEILDVIATPSPGTIRIEVDSTDRMVSWEEYTELPTSYVIRKYGQGVRQIVLTFDDGPDPVYSPQILDILRDEQVPAAFFILGVNAEANVSLVRRMYREGHEIGNHSFSHPNLAEIAPERVRVELNATRRIIESVTGHSTVLFRAPYNADSEPETFEELVPVELSKQDNYYTVGESIDPQDWQRGITADSIIARIKQQQTYGSIILLHDAGGDRSQTVKALPEIIRHFRGQGYTFTTVASLIGKMRDDVMPPITAGNDRMLVYANLAVVELVYWGLHLLFALFLVAIILSVGRIAAMAVLAVMQRRKEADPARRRNAARPLVSIIVPAYNEEVNAVKTVASLLRCTYPRLEVVFVDDGSRDSTYEKVREAFVMDKRVRVLTKSNGGKASALNFGIERAAAEFIVCIDADTIVAPDALDELMGCFTDDETAAVAGNIKVGNEHTVLARWQAIEYITSQNFDRRAFDLLNGITVVPGALGAFRKSAVLEAGGFTTDTLAEDCDLTLRLLRLGRIVRYCSSAIAVTEVPETVRMFLKQRFRWTFGIFQNLWKHRNALFNSSYGSLGFVALPNLLLFQFMLPILTPLADLVMLVSLLAGEGMPVLLYYLLFLAVDGLGAIVAFRLEKENPQRLFWLLPQRLVYRQLLYWVLAKSILTAIKGELIGWGILKRTGNVKPVPNSQT
jgi:cellulose synthase/poly-beta-1,6-N-acetylglucosamine synthase-like glycosyltransferase/peptidoglycan/xylan/chitin deacetylase (PgdA/CDA1 family)/spore germination protein YaaH